MGPLGSLLYLGLGFSPISVTDWVILTAMLDSFLLGHRRFVGWRYAVRKARYLTWYVSFTGVGSGAPAFAIQGLFGLTRNAQILWCNIKNICDSEHGRVDILLTRSVAVKLSYAKLDISTLLGKLTLIITFVVTVIIHIAVHIFVKQRCVIKNWDGWRVTWTGYMSRC